MKKLFLIVIFLVFLQIVLAEEVTLGVGESKEIQGYQVLLKNLRFNKAVVSVGEDSQILLLNEEEAIGALKIKLIEINYIDETEGDATLEITALYTCGDGNCDGPETKENCCKDCGCLSGFDCVNNNCQEHFDHECDKSEDCDDGDDNTLDKCIGIPRKCSHLKMTICETDTDCNDNNECTQDKCTNNDCFNENICTQNQTESQTPFAELPQKNQTENKTGITPQTETEKEKSGLIRRIIEFIKNLFI